MKNYEALLSNIHYIIEKNRKNSIVLNIHDLKTTLAKAETEKKGK